MANWCSAADVKSVCPSATEADGHYTQFIEAASDVLFARSGRQFGTRTVTVRPWCGCSSCDPATPSTRGGSAWRGCTYTAEHSSLSLGLGPIVDVVTVKVDGDVLVEGTDFRLDEATWLVRLPAAGSTTRRLWPTTQRLDLADTEDDTWSITALVGTPVPELGRLAAAELACELSRLGSDDCALSPRVQQVARQGVTLQLIGVSEALQTGAIGLPLCDLFCDTYNPSRSQARARVLFPPPCGVRRTDTDGPS